MPTSDIAAIAALVQQLRDAADQGPQQWLQARAATSYPPGQIETRQITCWWRGELGRRTGRPLTDQEVITHFEVNEPYVPVLESLDPQDFVPDPGYTFNKDVYTADRAPGETVPRGRIYRVRLKDGGEDVFTVVDGRAYGFPSICGKDE